MAVVVARIAEVVDDPSGLFLEHLAHRSAAHLADAHTGADADHQKGREEGHDQQSCVQVRKYWQKPFRQQETHQRLASVFCRSPTTDWNTRKSWVKIVTLRIIKNAFDENLRDVLCQFGRLIDDDGNQIVDHPFHINIITDVWVILNIDHVQCAPGE